MIVTQRNTRLKPIANGFVSRPGSAAFAIIASMAAVLAAKDSQAQTMTFEGLQDSELVNNFYNGGTGSKGSTGGANIGVQWSNGLAGFAPNGTFSNVNNEPSKQTVLGFLSGPAPVMNVAGGFTKGFSFYYAAPNTPGMITVWSGLNGTGNVLATLALPTNGSNSSFSQAYSNWSPIGVTFNGTADSVTFGGTANYIVFDDVTINSSTPDVTPPPPPPPLIPGNTINTSQPYFLASGVGTTTAPVFQGGTLRMDLTNGAYTQNFTLDGSKTNTIDQFGNSSTFGGAFSDAVAGTPGNIVFANSVLGGSVMLTGANTYTGTTTINSGAYVIVGSGGAVSNTSAVFNSGLLQIMANGTLTAGSITNFASGSIVNNGTVVDALNNYGSVTNSGAYTTDSLNNFAGATFTSTGTLTATTAINNNVGAVVNAQGKLTTPVLNNAGTFNVTGPLTSTIGTINNSGTVSLVNGVASDTLSATTLNGAGGTVAIDVNAKAGVADKFAVTNLTGSNVIAVSPVGGATYITTPVLIGTATTTAPGTTVVAAASPNIINYQVQQTGSNYYLVSTLNTSVASAAPAGIDSIIAALQTGFFQNSSAFISEPTDPKPNQLNGGPWIRVSTGGNDVSATTSAANPTTGTSTAPSKVRSNFSGFQVGGDVGVANIQNSGWNTHLGVTGGMVTIGTNDLLDPTTSARTRVPFVGVYGAITGHNFFADLQFREDFYNLSVTNGGAFLTGAPLTGNAYNINGSMGYKYDLGQNWFIEPSAALAYSHLNVKTLTVGLDTMGTTGSLTFNPFNSLLGRVGVRAGTTYVLEKASLALQPFVTGSVWREFAGNTSSTFITSTASVPLSVTRIGTFGQVGVGVSGQVLNTGLLGFLRGDYRFGDHLNGYALVAGMRYQF